jgi:hypothetical protein
LQTRLPWTYKELEPIGTVRRSLFELHDGRGAPQLPPQLDLEEVTRPASEEDVWFSTSDNLIEALGPHGQQYARSLQFEGKLNLSYVDPMLAATDPKKAYREAAEAQKKAEQERRAGRHGTNLKDLLIQYLRHVHPILEYQARTQHQTAENPRLDDALLIVFGEKHTKWLRRKRGDVSDLMNWTWLLTADTTERAATRLMVLTRGKFAKTDAGRKVPQAIFLFLLRRQHITARALQPLLVHAWELMEQVESPVKISIKSKESPEILDVNTIVYDPRGAARGMSENVFMIMIIRLLRSAIQVWPAACESIVALICRYLDGIHFSRWSSPSAALGSQEIALLTYKYNTILKLLALPSHRHPFQSALFQQRAQFSILRRMNQFEPPMVVDRRGYQAVVSMQLMHRKTTKEREWAHMKAKSWPPWKEEKLGIDARIGVEDGVSRANEALSRAREAGYGPNDWDAAAEVLSGWDTDGSPTIQTRTYLQRSSRKSNTEPKSNIVAQEDSALVWTARVRATRTLDEAWSCFLAYKDRTEVLSKTVYHEMLEKIVSGARRGVPIEASQAMDLYEIDKPMPGDGKEVLPGPESPKEATYVPTPAPDVDGFMQITINDKIKISGRFLATVLMAAPSFEKGVQYLEASPLSDQEVSTLLNPYVTGNPEKHPALKRIPHYLLGAYIRFLVKFAPSMPDHKGHHRFTPVTTGLYLSQHEEQTKETQPIPSLIDSSSNNQVNEAHESQAALINPLSRAFHLLISQRPWYRPAWYHALRALARPKAVTRVNSRFVDQDREDVRTWQLTCRLLDTMLDINLAVDLDGFLILCTHLEKAIFAAERMSRSIREGVREGKILAQVDRVLSQGLPLIKEIFKDTVRYRGYQQDLPIDAANVKNKTDERVERELASIKGNSAEDIGDHDMIGSQAFLPPACLLPRLLEVPHPAQLHAFIRVLGLSRDYGGILDLIEWMSLFGDEIDVISEESMNGKSMMRRCLTATRVFLERSWMEAPRGAFAGHAGILTDVEPATVEIVKAVEEVVMQNKQWGGWPTEREVDDYRMHGKFL